MCHSHRTNIWRLGCGAAHAKSPKQGQPARVSTHREAEPRCAASQLCKARTCPSHLAAISPSISARLMQVYMTPHACKLNIGSFYQQVCTTCKHELCKTINCLIIRGSSCAGCGEDTHSCRRGSPWTFSAWTAAVGLVMVFSLTSCPKQLMQHPMSPQHLMQGKKKHFIDGQPRNSTLLSSSAQGSATRVEPLYW